MHHRGHLRKVQFIACQPLIIFLLLLAANFIAGCGAADIPINPGLDEGIPVEVRAKAAPEVFANLFRGERLNLLIVLDRNLIERLAISRGEPPLPEDPQSNLVARTLLLNRTLEDMKDRLSVPGIRLLDNFSPISVFLIEVDSLAPFVALLLDPRIIRATENQSTPLNADEDLTLIGQAEAQSRGFGGKGFSVVIVDSGADPSQDPAFQNRVRYQEDLTGDNKGLPDDCYNQDGKGICHGTNVSATVHRVAPDADLIVFNVLKNGRASDNDLIKAIQWSVVHRTEYNIVAINMSIGRPPVDYECDSEKNKEDALRVAIQQARDPMFDILTVISAGNSCLINQIGRPACFPEAISVGAVYDTFSPISNSWGCQDTTLPSCTDVAPGPDLITCFSNSSSALTLLAPGPDTTAGKLNHLLLPHNKLQTLQAQNYLNSKFLLTMGGTSQAAPHVAGAIAVLKSAFPWMNSYEIVKCLTRTGIPIIDDRNGISTPRLDLDAATQECYGACYARCCDSNSTLVGPSYQLDANACKAWGENACGVFGTIRVEYNSQPIFGVSNKCGEACYVRCCDGFLAGPNYFNDSSSCSSWRGFACVGHGGSERVQFNGTQLLDETSQCGQRCEYLCCDGTVVSSLAGDKNSCFSGQSTCDSHGGAVSITYAGTQVVTGNGTCPGTCSARCCNGSIAPSVKTRNPPDCANTSFCSDPLLGGATRTIFKPDKSIYAGFPVKSDVICKACTSQCCDGTSQNASSTNVEQCRDIASAICGALGPSGDVKFDGNLVPGISRSCVEAYARCCQPDAMSSPHSHLAGPEYFKDAMSAEMEASRMCMMWKGPLRLQVDEAYQVTLTPACGNPAYAICQSGSKIGPIYYLDCKDDLMTLRGELDQACTMQGGLEKIEYNGKIVFDMGKEDCP